MEAAALSISCYRRSVAMARGDRRRTSGCTVIISSSPVSKPSTTLRIGRNWAELHGAQDWHGLLRPLDSELRGELVRYGEFVRAAYASFDFDGGKPSYGSCRFPRHSLLRRAGMPGSGYRVTSLLHATSTSAPGWLPSSPTCGSSYIGFVAVCDDEMEIERLGRRDVVVAFRGTVTCGEWVDNFMSGLTRLPIPNGDETEEEAMVASGFWRLSTTPGEAHSSLQQQVRDAVRRIAHEYCGSGSGSGTATAMPLLSITVTGHSLGAALAVLTAHEITTQQRHDQHGDREPVTMVTAISFGGPRVGNAAFRRRLEESGAKVLRVVNSNDVVTKVPGFPVRDDECGGEPSKGIIKARVLRWLVFKMGWAYTDVGRELRLRSRSQANVVASHDLNMYLKLLTSCIDC